MAQDKEQNKDKESSGDSVKNMSIQRRTLLKTMVGVPVLGLLGFEVSKKENMNEKQEILNRIGSKLMQDFMVERDRPEKDYRSNSEYNSNIFNALGSSMEDIDNLKYS